MTKINEIINNLNKGGNPESYGCKYTEDYNKYLCDESMRVVTATDPFHAYYLTLDEKEYIVVNNAGEFLAFEDWARIDEVFNCPTLKSIIETASKKYGYGAVAVSEVLREVEAFDVAPCYDDDESLVELAELALTDNRFTSFEELHDCYKDLKDIWETVGCKYDIEDKIDEYYQQAFDEMATEVEQELPSIIESQILSRGFNLAEGERCDWIEFYIDGLGYDLFTVEYDEFIIGYEFIEDYDQKVAEVIEHADDIAKKATKEYLADMKARYED